MIAKLFHNDSSRVTEGTSDDSIDFSLLQILPKYRQSPDENAKKNQSQINQV
jgi:hypothetical protein